MRWICLLSIAVGLSAANVRAQAPAASPKAGTAKTRAKPDSAKTDKNLQPHTNQEVALLPVSASAGASTRTEGTAHAITEHLRSLGFRVRTPQQVKPQLAAHGLDSCASTTTCDAQLALATLGVDAVISAAVWTRPSGPPQLAVHIRHRNGYGQAEIRASSAHDKALRAAAVTALRNALEDSRRTHEITVLIESEPSGAIAHVDQTLSGTTPVRFPLLPGSHLVSVESPGFIARAQYLELHEGSATDTKIKLKLDVAPIEPAAAAATTVAARKSEAHAREAEPEEAFELQPALEPAAPSASPAPSEPRRSPLNYVLAASLLGISAPFLANAIYAGATHEQCVGRFDRAGHCSERVTLGPLFFVSLGVGVLAAASGSAFLIFKPLGERETQAARLGPSQHF